MSPGNVGHVFFVLSNFSVKQANRLLRSQKSSILSSTSFQMGKTFWGVVSAAVEQSRRKPTWLLRETGNSALEADPRIPPNQKKS